MEQKNGEQVEESSKACSDGSVCGYDSLHHLLSANLKPHLFQGGLHLYLELTLRARKKISSVLKHLINKWGSSDAVVGEQVLFPYRIHDSVSTSRRWTLNDDQTCAGDVDAAIGSPQVFLLRYGWFSNEPKTFDKPSISAYDKVDLESEGVKRGTSTAADNAYGVDEKHVVFESGTSISIGGLISEASLQAKCNNGNKNQRENAKTLHTMDVKSDSRSFDLWADCPSTSVGGILFQPRLPELQQDDGRQESNTELINCSYLNNDEQSLGLSGIKWTDSLEPFDLGLPVSRKFCNAESRSFSGIVK